jgi:uncharacterized protein YycO
MIRRVTKSEWTHAAWVISETEVLESDWNGVHVNEIEPYKKDRTVFLLPIVSGTDLEKALEIARSKLGQRYDWSLFLSFLGCWIGSFLMPWRKFKVRNRKRGWICSELVATPLFQACGFRFTDDIPVEEVDPGDIAEAMITGRVRIGG